MLSSKPVLADWEVVVVVVVAVQVVVKCRTVQPGCAKKC